MQEAVDALSRAAERLMGNAELLLIPEMNAGLITDLDIDAEVCESRRATPDDPVLSLPTEVVKVAVEDIGVSDAESRSLSFSRRPTIPIDRFPT